MGVRLIHDADENRVAMYCSTSGFAFGPVFEYSADPVGDAQDFLDWLAAGAAPKLGVKPARAGADGLDPRQFDDGPLETLFVEWRRDRKPEEVA